MTKIEYFVGLSKIVKIKNSGTMVVSRNFSCQGGCITTFLLNRYYLYKPYFIRLAICHKMLFALICKCHKYD